MLRNGSMKHIGAAALLLVIVGILMFALAVVDASPTTTTTQRMMKRTTEGGDSGWMDYVDVFPDFARYVFFTNSMSLKKLDSNLLCARPNTTSGDCDWPAYAEALSWMAFIPLVIAVGFFPFACIAFPLCRICFCGKWKPTHGVCACRADPKKWRPDEHGYTRKEVIILLCIALVVAVGIAGCAIAGLIGNDRFSTGITGLKHTAYGTVDHVLEVLDTVTVTLEHFNSSYYSTADIAATVQSAYAMGTDLNTKVHDYDTVIDAVETTRDVFMWLNFCIPAVVMLLVVLAAFSGRGWLSWPMAILGFLFVFVALCLFSFYLPLGTVVNDSCFFLDNTLAETNPEASAVFDYFLSCSNTTGLASLGTLVSSALSTATTAVCDQYSTACNTSLPCDLNGDGLWLSSTESCPEIRNCSSSHCSGLESESLMLTDWLFGCADQLTGIMQTNPSTGLKCPFNSDGSAVCSSSSMVPVICNVATAPQKTADQCSANCTSTTIKSIAQKIVTAVKEIQTLNDLYVYSLAPLLDCRTLQGLFNRSKDYVCETVASGFGPVTYAEAVMAALCVAGTIVAAIGVKRFSKHNQLNHAQSSTSSSSIESEGGGRMIPLSKMYSESSTAVPVVQPTAPPANLIDVVSLPYTQYATTMPQQQQQTTEEQQQPVTMNTPRSANYNPYPTDDQPSPQQTYQPPPPPPPAYETTVVLAPMQGNPYNSDNTIAPPPSAPTTTAEDPFGRHSNVMFVDDEDA